MVGITSWIDPDGLKILAACSNVCWTRIALYLYITTMHLVLLPFFKFKFQGHFFQGHFQLQFLLDKTGRWRHFVIVTIYLNRNITAHVLVWKCCRFGSGTAINAQSMQLWKYARTVFTPVQTRYLALSYRVNAMLLTHG